MEKPLKEIHFIQWGVFIGPYSKHWKKLKRKEYREKYGKRKN